MNVLGNISVSVEFYCKLLPPANFYNFMIFVRKTHFFYFKKALSLKFLRTVTISVDSTASLLPLPFWKTWVFLEKPKFPLILPNPKNWSFWETLLIPSNCTLNLLPSAVFENFNIFSENPFFLQRKPYSWKFWEISLFRSHSTSNWLSLAVFKKSGFLSEKKNIFFFRTQIFE